MSREGDYLRLTGKRMLWALGKWLEEGGRFFTGIARCMKRVNEVGVK